MPKTSDKILDAELRAQFMEVVSEFLSSRDNEVLVTNSNEICVPCVDAERNDKFVVITFKVPTGSRDGEAYDGYAEAEGYAFHLKEKAEKAEASAKRKAVKIASDKAKREAKAKAKAEAKVKEGR